VRRYFAELEALAREARASHDPQVLICALRLVAHQVKTVREFIRRGML